MLIIRVLAHNNIMNNNDNTHSHYDNCNDSIVHIMCIHIYIMASVRAV